MKKFHLAWDDSRHTLGIASIDDQHRGLMDMINELVDVVEHGLDAEVAHQHIAKIIRFTEEHFAHEEGLMHQHDFPGRERHAAEHKEVLSQAVTMTEALKPGDFNRTMLVTAFLTDCVENHILREDKALVLYLLEKGLG